MECDGVKCISDDCLFYLQTSLDGCALKNVYLRKGTCRYYKQKTSEIPIDRKDLLGKTYVDFAVGDEG